MFSVNINFIAVAVAAIANMALGFIWYHPRVLGTAWMHEIGKTEEELSDPGPAYALTLVGSFVTAYVLALIIGHVGAASLGGGALTGLVAGVGFVATSFGSDALFHERSLRHYLISAGFYVVSLLIMGAILGVWQ